MLTDHHCLGLLVGLGLENVIFFLRVVTLTTLSRLCFVCMVEEGNVGAGELWRAWRGAGAAELPRDGQGEPAQPGSAQDRLHGHGDVQGWVTHQLWGLPGQGTAVTGLETASHGWGRTG